jgi:CheY-like chemotaxis protein
MIRSITKYLYSSTVSCDSACPVKAPHVPGPILVVDDNADGRDMLVEYLQFKGFTVREASTGAAALALAVTLRPRLILMDLARRVSTALKRRAACARTQAPRTRSLLP